MGPLVLTHVALLGVFVSATFYAGWNAWLARTERTLLIFAAQAALCTVLTADFVVLATTSSPAVAALALSVRLVSGLFAMSATAAMIARLTGIRARFFVRGVFVYAVAASLFHLLVRSSQDVVLTLGHVTYAWGETVTVPIRYHIPWYFAPSYAVVMAVNVFGVVGAVRLGARDRVGGLLIGLAAASGLLSTSAAMGTDFLRTLVPYFGNIPFAFWVIFVAMILSRENLKMRLRQSAAEQRLRGIFDHTLDFMGLLDSHGTVLEANRTVLEAAGVSPDTVVGKPFWTVPFWAHSEPLKERVREAVRTAASGETVRFETTHPLPDGGTGHVDFSLKPVRDAQGAVVLLIPEGRDITARKKTEEALDRLVDVIAPRTGQDFFQGMVDTLCEICEVDYAFAAAPDPRASGYLRTIALSHRGQAAENFSYLMAGTPCEGVVQRELCYYAEGVQALFPDDHLLGEFRIESYMGIPMEPSSSSPAGVVALMHHAPMRHPEQAKALLHVVSARAGAELERRRADAALQESESRFRSLVEGLDVGVVLQDAQERILLGNPAAVRMLGVPHARLSDGTARGPGDPLVREDGTPFPTDQLPSVTAARTGLPVRNVIVGATNQETGARTWIQVTATPTQRQDGSLRHILLTLVDVTDRKRAEDAVRSSSRRLALAISATSDAVWEWNYRTGETYYSPRWFEMLGLAPDLPMTISTWELLCHPDDLDPTLARIEEALHNHSAFEVVCRMRRADGEWAWVLGRGKAVEWDADGNPTLLAGTNTDITARTSAETRRRELEAQLAQAQRMESMGRLAGGIAHDFNNILTIINGYADLLLLSLSGDNASKEMLEDIRNAGDRAAALTRQLLTFSRHQVVDPDIIDLNAIVADTERMLQRLIGEHIHLRTELDETPLWVRADPGQLGQVIVNLAVNGRDAMPGGGELRVSTALVTLDEMSAVSISPDARRGSYAVLSVTDNGSGIPADLQPLVFEPFFTTKGPGKGTGLGLATVHGIAHQCDGFMSVSSQTGSGSTFRLYVPSVLDPDPVPRQEPPATASVESRKTVLMVEDEAPVRHVVRTMLERMGLDVLAASGGEEALRLFNVHPGTIDLLVTDVIMPGLNGRQLAEQLLARRPGLRVLYMSGYTDDIIVQHVVMAADAAYVQKPFDAETLGRKVRQALDAAPPGGAAAAAH